MVTQQQRAAEKAVQRAAEANAQQAAAPTDQVPRAYTPKRVFSTLLKRQTTKTGTRPGQDQLTQGDENVFSTLFKRQATKTGTRPGQDKLTERRPGQDKLTEGDKEKLLRLKRSLLQKEDRDPPS